MGAHAASAGSNSPTQCATGKQVVNVNYTLTNDYDSGVHGNAWANDTINRHLQVWQAGSGQYCALVNDTGSFVTFAGDSPNGTGSVAEGVTGRINGGYTTTVFSGTFNPSRATKGNLGSFDLQCTSAYDCPGAHPSFLDYFNPGVSYDLATWGWTYHTAQNGDWLNSDAADTGDITS